MSACLLSGKRKHRPLSKQLEQLRLHSQTHNWPWCNDHIFRDDGYSGASLRRPGLDRLRDQINVAAFDRVLITEPSRLARKYVHQVLLIEEFEREGRQVEFLDQPKSDTPHDQLLLLGNSNSSAEERVAIFLITWRKRLSIPGTFSEPVPLPMRRQDIADFLGLRLETVSRTLTKLEQKNAVRVVPAGVFLTGLEHTPLVMGRNL